jgi:imidazole glycerol-phosphate synthase subunit HisH
MITIIDSGIANMGSVLAAMRRIGACVQVTTEAAAVRGASALLLPGVGTFAGGMESLRRHGLIEPLRAAAAAGKPIFGICVGMQLLAEAGEEFGEHQGLGLLPGRVKKLPAGMGRIPNIGWCDLAARPAARLFRGVEDSSSFYFVHSYHMVCATPSDSVGTIAFGEVPITVAVERGNIFGVQFHPEKSQDVGLAVLANFVSHATGKP